MAQQVVTSLICDFPHRGKEVPANDTLHLSVDGKHYELDLCEQDQVRVGKLVSQMTEHARTVKESWKQTTHRRTMRRQSNGSSGPSNAEVRAWARDHDVELSDRGRIPANVIQMFQESQAS